MTFAPDVTERLARARADLRMGVPVVLDGGAVMMAAETVDAARLGFEVIVVEDACRAIDLDGSLVAAMDEMRGAGVAFANAAAVKE